MTSRPDWSRSLGDMLIILRHNGKKAAAYGVDGATMTVMLVTAALLLLGS